MDYYEIGQRVRKFRKAHALSQEELAEKIGISVTHMSHIETGNTKLSLPVLVALAVELEVRTDDLLFEQNSSNGSAMTEEIVHELNDCSVQQLNIISEVIRTVKTSLKKYL